MELRQLRSFVRVADCGSFSRAACELNLTQPAVTSQIQVLEHELGISLLERLPRRVLLTPAGERLLPYARSLLNLEEEALRALGELKGLQVGCLRVGASPTIGGYLLPKMLGEFGCRYPSIRVIAEIGPTQRVVDSLETHALDLGLVEAQVSSEVLTAEVFLTDELVLVVPADHPWARRRSVSAQELTEQPLVGREPTSGTQRLLNERLQSLGVRITPRLELGATEAIKNAVLAGLGIAFLSRLAIQTEEQLGTLSALSVDGLDLRRPLYCVQYKQRYVMPATRAFLDFVRRLEGVDAGP